MRQYPHFGRKAHVSYAQSCPPGAKSLQLCTETQRAAENQRRENKFGVVVEDFIARHVKGKRKAADVEREIRRELIPAWRNEAVTDITRRDMVTLIEAIVDRGAKYQAHNVLSHARKFRMTLSGRRSRRR